MTANVNLAAIAFLGFGAALITGISYLLIALYKTGMIARTPIEPPPGSQVPFLGKYYVGVLRGRERKKE